MSDEKNVAVKAANNSKGQLIDVGGHKLYCQASGEGSPVVVMEAGLGATTDMLYWLEQEISRFTTVFSYNRAGLGQSEIANKPVDFQDVVSQLHTLLQKAGIKGPYILLGHSLGGLFIRGFAAQYPEEVAGLVFLDATHPEQFKRSPKWLVWQRRSLGNVMKFPWLAKKLLQADTSRSAGGLPAEQIARLQAAYGSDKHFKTMKAEIKADVKLMAAAGKLGPVGAKPVLVFSAGLPKASYMPIWHQMQRELAELSTTSTHQILPDATHVNLVTNRENALVIAEAIHVRVKEIRTGKSIA